MFVTLRNAIRTSLIRTVTVQGKCAWALGLINSMVVSYLCRAFMNSLSIQESFLPFLSLPLKYFTHL